MDIAVIGVGYVGLVTGTCLAEMGHHVICLDINSHKIDRLKHGEIPIYEAGLEEMVRRNLHAKRLTFTTDYPTAVTHGKICFIAVETPLNSEGAADLRSVERAALSLADAIDDYRVIVNKSTAPVGTANFIKQIIQERLKKRGSTLSCDVVSNPEFLKEGEAVKDFMEPERVIIGVDSAKALLAMTELYAPFMLSEEQFIVMDVASAEMVKYAANAMLAARISFMNEISTICSACGADVEKIRKGIGSDSRIGAKFLHAGIGFGGSCLPKDLRALRTEARNLSLNTPLLDAIDEVNTRQKRLLSETIENYFFARGKSQKICITILGLAFKPNTDDMREASSIILIQQLLQKGISVRLYDPVAMEQAKKLLPDTPAITWCRDELHACFEADGIALITEWKQFCLLEFPAILKVMRGNAFFDGRNQYHPARMAELGFDYFSIGREPHYASCEPLSHHLGS